MAQAKTKKTRARKASKKKASKTAARKKTKGNRSKSKASRSQTRQQRMTALRDKGWTYEKLGEKFNLSRQRVYQILNDTGDKPKPQEPGQPKRELLRGRGIQAKLKQYNDPKELGDRIVRKRLLMGKTIGELSEISGIPYGVLSTYENNKAQPSCENLKKLSVALRVSAHWLLFGHPFRKATA